MATTLITQPVDIRDNGVRSFIPPSFCFELVAATGEILDVVSAVGFRGRDHPDLTDFEAANHLAKNGLMSLGEVSEYDAGRESREAGRRYTVTEVIPRGRVVQDGGDRP